MLCNDRLMVYWFDNNPVLLLLLLLYTSHFKRCRKLDPEQQLVRLLNDCPQHTIAHILRACLFAATLADPH